MVKSIVTIYVFYCEQIYILLIIHFFNGKPWHSIVSPRSSDPFYIESNYMEWVTIYWTYSTYCSFILYVQSDYHTLTNSSIVDSSNVFYCLNWGLVVKYFSRVFKKWKLIHKWLLASFNQNSSDKSANIHYDILCVQEVVTDFM